MPISRISLVMMLPWLYYISAAFRASEVCQYHSVNFMREDIAMLGQQKRLATLTAPAR